VVDPTLRYDALCQLANLGFLTGDPEVSEYIERAAEVAAATGRHC